MVLLGVDPHKDTHTVVAVDQAGRQLGQLTVAARTLGHAELLGWARRRWPDERRWAVEDCRHVTGRLERDLLAAGERVVRVPPRLMAGARQAVRIAGAVCTQMVLEGDDWSERQSVISAGQTKKATASIASR